MDSLIVTGNGPLRGEVVISGAKNAALPCLAATILTQDQVHLSNLPMVRDIKTMCRLLAEMGMQVELGDQRVDITGAGLNNHIAPYDLVKTMRASILVLGPLVARYGEAQVSLPGGCAIGARPVNLHLEALRRMGAEINLDHGYIHAKASRLKGCTIVFENITVTGTENIMMAATLAEGRTILQNAAKEPEVVDLALMLTNMGAKIHGAGTDTITIDGVPRLHGCEHRIIPDRIETGTYVCAAAITGGDVRIVNTAPHYLTAFLETMKKAGLPLTSDASTIHVGAHKGLTGVSIQTQPHPGFPTDMQAQFMAVMTKAQGTSVIKETIFENRFQHVPELQRMGANIQAEGHTAIINGPCNLSGAEVMATDLRASASLVIAGLVADEETHVTRIYHLDRGYDSLEVKLAKIGALIRRVSNKES